MKTLLFSAFCFLSIAGSNAQVNTLFGIKGGFNASSISGLNDLASASSLSAAQVEVSTKAKPGLHIGIVSQINVSKHFFVQPELLYSLQGVKFSGDISSYSYSENSNLHYLQLPIYAGAKMAAGKGVDIILGVGPYLGFGIAGDEGTFDDDGIFRRFDFGLTAMGGVQLNRFQITIGYDLGLVDLINTPGWSEIKSQADLSSISNRNFKASVAYFF